MTTELFTAEQLREMANVLDDEGRSYVGDMLHQAADDQERLEASLARLVEAAIPFIARNNSDKTILIEVLTSEVKQLRRAVDAARNTTREG